MTEIWTSQHHALLNALRTQDLLPWLIQRLSQERIRPSNDDLQRLRDWPQALMESNAWPLIKDALKRPEAWPDVWHRAHEMGFSTRAHHHHALFFMDLSHSLRESDDLDVAIWSLTQSLQAWTALAHTDYLKALGMRVLPSAPSGLVEETIGDLLKEDVQAICQWVEESLKRSPPHERTNTLALGFLSVLEDADTTSPLKLARALASATREKLNMLPGARLREILAEQDLLTVNDDTLVAPFKEAAELTRHLAYPDLAVSDLVHISVETCWALRKIDRDDMPAFKRIVETISPLNEILFERLLAGKIFGQNSRSADFLVFRAEPLNGVDRRALLERGRKVCPDHRNSSMLLSHTYLDQATIHFVTLKRVPSAAKNTAIPRKILKDIAVLLAQAESVFPFNTKLDTMKTDYASECTRFNIDPSEFS